MSKISANQGTRRTSSTKRMAQLGDDTVGLEYNDDGRATFQALGMRKPVGAGGPYVGRKLITKPGGNPRNPITYDDAIASVDDVIKEWQGQQCSVSLKDQRQNLTDLYNYIYHYELTGLDAYEILRTAKNVLGREGIDVYLPSRGSTRIDRLSITPETTGTRGASINKISPSFMWSFVTNNCENLGPIVDFVYATSARDNGIDLSKVQDYSKYKSSNGRLLEFVQGADQYGNCSNIGEAQRLFDDFDQLNLNGEDIIAFVHYFTNLFGGKSVNRSKFRVDGLNFRPEAAPSGRITKSTKPKRIKASLLWYIVQNYCDDLPLMVTTLEQKFALAPASGTRTIQFNRKAPRVPATQPLPYAEGQSRRGSTVRTQRQQNADESGSEEEFQTPQQTRQTSQSRQTGQQTQRPKNSAAANALFGTRR